MKFQPNAHKDSVPVKLVEGSLNRFDGKELQVGTGLASENRSKEGASRLNRRKFILLMRKIITLAKQNKIKSISIDFKNFQSIAPKPERLHDVSRPSDVFSDFEIGKVAAEAMAMANYEHTAYKTKPKDGFVSVDVVAFVGISADGIEGAKKGHWIAEGVNACRELSNTPGGDMTPKVLAQAAKKAVSGTKATVKVLGVKEMQELGMGAVLGIGKGSKDEPQFIVMEYWGAGRPPQRTSLRNKGQSFAWQPIVLVGKGVTFDTGGLNLKPGDHMYEMHMDMSGGAAVIHAVALAAKLKLKKNVVGLIPAVENMAGAGAVRPGDILKSLSGKTIEVLNTDAEGRVILADGITYAKRYNPAAVIDVATLTGASLVAIGTQASLFMTNDENKITEILDVAEQSGDYMWPLPAWEEYEAMVKGTFGDIPNLSTDGSSRDGGVIAGGMFLREFAKELDCLWIHVDMAPRMTARSDEYLAKGAAGAPVRFLLSFIENGVK